MVKVIRVAKLVYIYLTRRTEECLSMTPEITRNRSSIYNGAIFGPLLVQYITLMGVQIFKSWSTDNSGLLPPGVYTISAFVATIKM